MARTELVINLTLGAIRMSLWCDECLTSAGYEVDVHHLADDGLHPFGTIRRCHRCDDDD